MSISTTLSTTTPKYHQAILGLIQQCQTEQAKTTSSQSSQSSQSHEHHDVASSNKSRFMIYGCTGYTGKLVTELCAQFDDLRTDMVILAGRNEARVNQMAQQYGFMQPTVHFDLELPPVPNRGRNRSKKAHKAEQEQLLVQKLVQILRENRVGALLNIAGPFSQTAKPLIEACIAARVHYLDVTGEIDVFEYSLSNEERDSRAQKAEICVVSGVGFDVVPSDCLAKRVVQSYRDRFDGATPHSLQLAIFFAMGGHGENKVGVSRGTLKTMVENVVHNRGKTQVRKNGTIGTVNLFSDVQEFRFEPSGRNVECSAVSWGDVSTAYYSTEGVPNVRVYFPMSAPWIVRKLLNFFVVQWMLGLVLRLPYMTELLHKLIDRMLPPGPEESIEEQGPEIVAIAKSKDGEQVVRGEASACPSYIFAAKSALMATLRCLAGDVERYGCGTPSMVFGDQFIDQLDDNIAQQKVVEAEE